MEQGVRETVGGQKMNVKPFGGRILVKREKAKEQLTGGILIPDNARKKPREAKVVAVGAGRLDEHGNRIAMQIKKDDLVLASTALSSRRETGCRCPLRLKAFPQEFLEVWCAGVIGEKFGEAVAQGRCDDHFGGADPRPDRTQP